MFGYIRPLRCELKVREDAAFRSVYCGLCHTLSKEYGFHTRFILNYDFTFLALVLAKSTNLCEKKCIASPFRKKCILAKCDELSDSAAASIIYFWWKLQDELVDHRGIKRLKAWLILKCFSRSYKKAKKRLPQFDHSVSQSLYDLQELEIHQDPRIDAAADTFARCLSALADLVSDEIRKRPLHEMFYHIGRWIYLIDAADDLQQDLQNGNYNPLALRYEIQAAPLTGDAKNSLDITLQHSIRLAENAWALLPLSPYQSIVENILHLGLITVQNQVFSGVFHKKRK